MPPLPDAGTMGKLAYRLPYGDSNSLMNLSEAARVNLFQLVAYADDQKIDTVKFSSTPRRNLVKGDSFSLLAYSSAKTTLTGELSGFHRVLLQSSKQVWNAPLTTGWNWVSGQVDAFEAATGLWPVNYSGVEPATQATFHLQEGVGGVGVSIEKNDANGDVNVIGILPGSPAAAAGLQIGDVILKVETQNLGKESNIDGLKVPFFIRGEVGTLVNLTIRRGAQTLELKVNRALLPANASQTTG